MTIPEYARGYEGFEGRIGRTTASSQPAWPAEPTPPKGAPNVIVIVADDLGYSDIGPTVRRSHPESAAARGQRVTMTNYHTAPMCSPARASLLTGVNPHRAGFGFVSNVDPGFPGMRIEFGEGIATLPRILRDRGYATMAFGKWHLVREANMHEGAPKDSWPCQQGFDHYYGSLEGLNSFFEPNQLVVDNSVVDNEEWPDDYYVTDDLTDRAVSQILALRSANPNKPFFCYFSHLAVHAPFRSPPMSWRNNAASTPRAGMRSGKSASAGSASWGFSAPRWSRPPATTPPGTTSPRGTSLGRRSRSATPSTWRPTRRWWQPSTAPWDAW